MYSLPSLLFLDLFINTARTLVFADTLLELELLRVGIERVLRQVHQPGGNSKEEEQRAQQRQHMREQGEATPAHARID